MSAVTRGDAMNEPEASAVLSRAEADGSAAGGGP